MKPQDANFQLKVDQESSRVNTKPNSSKPNFESNVGGCVFGRGGNSPRWQLFEVTRYLSPDSSLHSWIAGEAPIKADEVYMIHCDQQWSAEEPPSTMDEL